MGLWFREMVAREKSRTLACSPKPMVSEAKCLRGQHHRYAIHVHLLDNLCWASNTCENERAKRPKLERAKRPEKKLAKRPLYRSARPLSILGLLAQQLPSTLNCINDNFDPILYKLREVLFLACRASGYHKPSHLHGGKRGQVSVGRATEQETSAK